MNKLELISIIGFGLINFYGDCRPDVFFPEDKKPYYISCDTLSYDPIKVAHCETTYVNIKGR